MKSVIQILVLFVLVSVSWALDPALPPGSNFDLSRWKLQLPTSNGVLTASGGSVDELSTSQLTSGTTNAYFYTGGDGAMVFYAPNNGATTSGSTHPRSELRELINPNDSGVNWSVYGTHILTGQCKVLQVPVDTGKVCIGQMHEPNNKPDGSASANNEHMVMFDLNNQRIYANVNLDGDQSSTFSRTFITGAGVALSNTINYTMSASNGLLMIVVNNVTNSWDLFSGTNFSGHVAQNWDRASSNTLYFKAGSYNQVTDENSAGGAKVAFYGLSQYHAPAITNQPAGVTSGVGSNVSFTVGAVGNGTLTYQWRLGTTTISGATNATLSLTNISGTNAGNYTVIVTDNTSGFSSVTSSVAVLTGNFPPVINSQPADQLVNAGNNATFTVGAGGVSPLFYRWRFNTTNLVNATNSALTITNAQFTNAGNYTVVVSNSLGVVTSAVAVLTVDYPPVTSTNVWLDDTWTDGTRNDTALPIDAAWFASLTAALTAAPNALGGAPDPTNTLTWWTYFTTNLAAPVHLGTNDALRLTLKFTTSGVAANNNNRGLRIGLFNSANGTRTLADGANPNGTNYTGYMLNMNFGTTFGLSSPLQFLERTNISSGNLVSTVNDYSTLSSGGPANGSTAFTNGLTYTFVLTAKRNNTSLDLTAAFTCTNGFSATHTSTDSAITGADFDTFVFRPALQSQTATNFTFTEFKVELVSTNNHAPLAVTHTAIATQNKTLTIAAAGIAAADFDSDGDALTVTAVAATSTNSGTVSRANSSISYTPPLNYLGADRLSYTLTDLRGATATGYVFLNVVSPLKFTGLALTNQSLKLNFTGSSGSNYVLQAKTNLTDPAWQSLTTNATDNSGLGIFSNLATTNPPQRFFRIVSP